MGRRSTGLTRAKRIEQLTLWLGLPLLLLLLSLTAGVVAYTPVRQHPGADAAKSEPGRAAPAGETAPQSPTVPVRSDLLVPLPAPAETGSNLDEELELEVPPAVS